VQLAHNSHLPWFFRTPTDKCRRHSQNYSGNYCIQLF